MTLRERLLAQSEPDYRAFASSLLPGVEHVMGVRIPKLRRLAREIARGDWRTYLRTAEELYFEERMLQGLVIGYAPCDAEERLAWTSRPNGPCGRCGGAETADPVRSGYDCAGSGPAPGCGRNGRASPPPQGALSPAIPRSEASEAAGAAGIRAKIFVRKIAL